VHRLEQQAVGALELVDDGLGQVCEADIGMLIVQILGELGNALGVGLRLELETLADQ